MRYKNFPEDDIRSLIYSHLMENQTSKNTMEKHDTSKVLLTYYSDDDFGYSNIFMDVINHRFNILLKYKSYNLDDDTIDENSLLLALMKTARLIGRINDWFRYKDEQEPFEYGQESFFEYIHNKRSALDLEYWLKAFNQIIINFNLIGKSTFDGLMPIPFIKLELDKKDEVIVISSLNPSCDYVERRMCNWWFDTEQNMIWCVYYLCKLIEYHYNRYFYNIPFSKIEQDVITILHTIDGYNGEWDAKID